MDRNGPAFFTFESPSEATRWLGWHWLYIKAIRWYDFCRIPKNDLPWGNLGCCRSESIPKVAATPDFWSIWPHLIYCVFEVVEVQKSDVHVIIKISDQVGNKIKKTRSCEVNRTSWLALIKPGWWDAQTNTRRGGQFSRWCNAGNWFKKTQGKHHDFSVNDICSCLCVGLAIWMDHRWPWGGSGWQIWQTKAKQEWTLSKSVPWGGWSLLR